MGSESDEEERGKREADMKKVVLMKTHMACLWSFLVSLGGATMLWWWECHYHPVNTQLWMVPVGLILLVTPVMVWVALFVSEICYGYAEADKSLHHQELVHDPERYS